VAGAEDAAEILTRWRSLPAGGDAALIGEVTTDPARVVLHTEIGGQRILEELEDDPLPRIC
jgi:hydrogenase expression/formation protein HypE